MSAALSHQLHKPTHPSERRPRRERDDLFTNADRDLVMKISQLVSATRKTGVDVNRSCLDGAP